MASRTSWTVMPSSLRTSIGQCGKRSQVIWRMRIGGDVACCDS